MKPARVDALQSRCGRWVERTLERYGPAAASRPMAEVEVTPESLNPARRLAAVVEERDMITAVEVAPRAGYRIWLRYSDGVSGEVDLADLAGRGIFGAWLDRSFFEKVHVSPYGSIAWSDDVELCEDALYLRLTGKSVEEVMPAARLPRVHA